MRRSFVVTLAALFILSGLMLSAPSPGRAQDGATPSASGSPQAIPGVETVIKGAVQDPERKDVVEALMVVTISEGASLPLTSDVLTGVFEITDGQVVIEVTDGTAAYTRKGEIQRIEPGQTAELMAGDVLGVQGATLTIMNKSGQQVVLNVSARILDKGMCWICPWPWYTIIIGTQP